MLIENTNAVSIFKKLKDIKVIEINNACIVNNKPNELSLCCPLQVLKNGQKYKF